MSGKPSELVDKGIALYDQGKYDEAIKAFVQKGVIVPAGNSFIYNLGIRHTAKLRSMSMLRNPTIENQVVNATST